MKRVICVLLCVLMLCSCLIGCSGGEEEVTEIKIGVVVPQSGNNALTGQYMLNAISLVEDELAESGGITVKDGRTLPVTFYVEDNENQADITTNCYTKLIDETNVLAIVGPDSSTAILAGGPVAQSAGCPAISTFGTNIRVTEIGDYIFRACFIDSFQGEVMAQYAYEDLGARNVAVIYNNANDFSVGLTESFIENFTALGGTICEQQSYSGSDVRDFNVQMTNIKASNPDAVYMPGMLAELPLMLQQAKNVGIDCPILSGDAADTPELAEMAGAEYVEGLTYTSAFSAESQEPAAVAFVEAYESKFGEAPNSNAVLAYESAELILEAVRTAESLDRASIRDALAAIKDFEVPSGTITFDENRNPIKGAVILQFRDGVSHYVTSINP